MVTPKQEIQAFVERLPDDATWEEVQYHIYVRQKIERALEDVKHGRTFSHEEVKAEMQKWLTSSMD